MQAALLGVAPWLTKRDCWALEVCCRAFCQILRSSEFHAWLPRRERTPLGYRLVLPNGECTYDLALRRSDGLFGMGGADLALVGDFEQGTRWLTRFYILDGTASGEAEPLGFLWRDRFWLITTLGKPPTPWWAPVSATVCESCQPCTLESLPTSDSEFLDPVNLDALDPQLASYLPPRLLLHQSEL